MSLVLVVEDEVDLAQVMRDRLVADGHEAVVAHDGAAALAAVARRVPDIVLLDWMLPDMDGLAVCRRLRERHLMPIIMVTARSEEVDRVLGLEVGADDYLVKPFSPASCWPGFARCCEESIWRDGASHQPLEASFRRAL